MISEAEWKRSYKRYFPSSVQSKSSHFRFDVSCALLGIKPVHLVDSLPPDPHKLQHFLHEVLQSRDFTSQSREQHTTSHDNMFPTSRSHDYPQLCILAIEQDVLLLNDAVLKISHGALSTPHPVFIDVTRGLLKPKVMNKDDTHQIEQLLSDCLEGIQKSILSSESESSKWNITVTQYSCHGDRHGTEVNLCSLFGQLLGYPVVYWFDTTKGYSLDMEKLVCHCVVARMERVKPTSTSSGNQEKIQDSSDFPHTLFSFTVPECILSTSPEVRGTIASWYDTVRARAARQEVQLDMSTNTVLLPSVAL